MEVIIISVIAAEVLKHMESYTGPITQESLTPYLKELEGIYKKYGYSFKCMYKRSLENIPIDQVTVDMYKDVGNIKFYSKKEGE